jgi:hypothetical protein
LAIAAQCARNTSLMPGADERDMTQSTLNPRRCLNQVRRGESVLWRTVVAKVAARLPATLSSAGNDSTQNNAFGDEPMFNNASGPFNTVIGNDALFLCDDGSSNLAVAMFLNEFLKEHKKVEELEGTVASLVATVKEQTAQIQKVSAQLEVSKPAPQVVVNKE